MKLFAKMAAMALSAVMAASAFGCGSSSTASDSSSPGFEPQEIEINDPGFSITDDGNLRYAFIAVNPNDGYVAEDVTFTIEAYDANGSMIAGSSESVPVLYPGAETAGAGETELYSRDTETPEVASLSIVALESSINWETIAITNDDLEDSIDIVKPRMDRTDEGNVEIMASIGLVQGDELKLDASKPIELRAVAILFDKSGNAICGTSPVLFTLNGESETYDFDEVIADAPAYAECMLYVTPSTIL